MITGFEFCRFYPNNICAYNVLFSSNKEQVLNAFEYLFYKVLVVSKRFIMDCYI